MKALWFEFGNDTFTGFKMPSLIPALQNIGILHHKKEKLRILLQECIWFYNANMKFSRHFNGLLFFELVFQIVQSWRSVDFEMTFLCLQIYQNNHEIFVKISALIMGYLT